VRHELRFVRTRAAAHGRSLRLGQAFLFHPRVGFLELSLLLRREAVLAARLLWTVRCGALVGMPHRLSLRMAMRLRLRAPLLPLPLLLRATATLLLRLTAALLLGLAATLLLWLTAALLRLTAPLLLRLVRPRRGMSGFETFDHAALDLARHQALDRRHERTVLVADE